MKSVVFMFSGQGSQYYQMGRDLMRNLPSFRKWMEKLDGMFRDLTGTSIIETIYQDGEGGKSKSRADRFERHSSAAIFLIEFALARALIEKGIEPDHLLGASLGEFASAAVAGVLEPGEALEILTRSADIFEKNCERGGMLSVLHDVEMYENTPLLYRNSELASINFRSHFIISGTDAKLEMIRAHLSGQGIYCLRLRVSFPFHSSLMEPCRPPFMDCLESRTFHPPDIPLISCSRAGWIDRVEPVGLWEAIRKPVLFRDTIREVEKKSAGIYLDLGPSGILAAITRHNLSRDSGSKIFACLTPRGRDLENLEKIRSYFLENRGIGQ